MELRTDLLPKNVKIVQQKEKLCIEGPLGRIILPLKSIEKKQVTEQIGLFRSLLDNAIIGVTRGYLIRLKLVGVGFRAYKVVKKPRRLLLKVGFSHRIRYEVNMGIKLSVKKKNTLVSLFGIQKEMVHQAAAQIKALRLPDSYKGKGIRYLNETIRCKVGKKTN